MTMTIPSTPQWIEAIVSLLLVASGVCALLAAWGLVRLREFFQRLHPPALLTTGAAWCTSLAAVVYFSSLHQRWSLSTWLIPVVLSISVPITSMMLARAALFRRRQHQDDAMPPPLLSSWREDDLP